MAIPWPSGDPPTTVERPSTDGPTDSWEPASCGRRRCELDTENWTHTSRSCSVRGVGDGCQRRSKVDPLATAEN